MICRKERPHPGAQLSLFDIEAEWRHAAFVLAGTGEDDHDERDVALLELRHRRHARVEDRIRQAKAAGLRNLPCKEAGEIEAWLECVLAAADVVCWARRPKPSDRGCCTVRWGKTTSMAIVTSSGFAHVRLTVTDIKKSKEFYDKVFGWPVAIDASDQVDEPGVRQSPDRFYGGVVYQTPAGALFGLRPAGTQRFDSEHTGLDHISFMVGSRGDLVEARRALQDAGVEHGDIKDLPDAGLAILSFSDPDGVHLELTAPLG